MCPYCTHPYMLREAKENLTEGTYLWFQTDGSVLNLHRLMAHTKTLEVILQLLFADGYALLAHSEIALQAVVKHFADPAKAYDLNISLKKTEVREASAWNLPPSKHQYWRNTIEHFTYLGSVISNDATVAKDVDNCLTKASSSFGRLQKHVWKNHSLRLTTLVYRAAVVTTLLHGSEAWVLYRKQVQLLEPFHQRCLWSTMGTRWQDYVTNNEVLERADINSIEAMILTRQLRWAGHLSHMEDTTFCPLRKQTIQDHRTTSTRCAHLRRRHTIIPIFQCRF